MDYKESGVDIEAGYKSVELMRQYVARTMRPETLGGLGGFSGAFDMGRIKEMEDPVLLSGADGCGTKVKLAFIMDKHDTIGIDAVAMCVNDIACAGAEPLFFLDYISCGKNDPEKIAQIVKGVAEGCVQADAALIGGETAEHPGLMPEDEYDLAGFAVGVCDRKDLITGEGVKAGDVLIGLASTGVHSNGFSLIRKIFDMTNESLGTYSDELGGTLGETLLAPTRIYVHALKNMQKAGSAGAAGSAAETGSTGAAGSAAETGSAGAAGNAAETGSAGAAGSVGAAGSAGAARGLIKACSHITGGGFYENVPRMLPEGMRAVIRKDSYPIPPVFSLIQRTGDLSEETMYNTFNMGIGMVLAVDPADAECAVEAARAAGDTPYVIGEIAAGERGVTLCQ